MRYLVTKTGTLHNCVFKYVSQNMQELNPLGLSKLNFLDSYNISVEPYYSFNKTTESSQRQTVVEKLHSIAEIATDNNNSHPIQSFIFIQISI